ncbi:MAG: hypothetical protein LBI15_11280 [Dysgonamonadaceae bacterium]|jgi:hypothetical protein|nr:hypothetical protein [Dysgonamonadaceae bacterium]
MKSLKLFFLLASAMIIALLTFAQCDLSKENDEINCSKQFETIGLMLRYPDGEPVLLDSTKVFWVSQNRFLEQDPFWWKLAREWGNYIIVDDLMRKELRGKKEIMRFMGYLNDRVVIERDILVGANYCHVEYLGTEPLSIQIAYDSEIFCTDQFEFIGLLLRYPNGEPVLLDSTKVFWVSQNKYLEQNKFWWGEARKWGNYIIVDDLMRKELQGKEEIMRFTGYLNNKIVIEREVLVGANYCHVEYLGTESLTQVIEP